MDKEKFKDRLKKYDFTFSDFNNVVTIQVGHSLVVDVDFNLFEKILISDRLLRGNFLTGIIEMKLNQAVISNFLVLVVLGVFFIVESSHISQFYLLMAYMISISWIVLWSIYYNIKSETLKKTVMIWLESGD